MNAVLRLLVVLLSIASAAYSQTFTDGPWSYTIDYSNPAAGKANITGYSGAGGAVVIPSTLGGFVVGSINAYAMVNNSSITSVIIPNSVTTIGQFAFGYCTSLTSVTIPEGVTFIGQSAFRECTSLTSVKIPDSVTTIWNSAFKDCRSLTSATIGNGVKFLAQELFYGCTSLTSITIPDSVEYIASGNEDESTSGAFQNCISLTNVTIGNGVKYIYNFAFAGCSSLTSVTLGSSVESIGKEAFAGCSSLTSITIPGSVNSFRGGVFKDCVALQSVYFLGNMPSVAGALFGGISPAGTVHYPRGNTTWGASYVGWSTQPYDLPPPPVALPTRARARVEYPVGATLISGGSYTPFPASLIGVASSNRVYTLRNTGSTVLSNIVVAKSGPNSAEFSFTPPTSSSLAAGAVTTFSVGFLPASSGSRTAQISITSSDTNNSPFLINLSGSAVSADADTDGDGLNDAAEVAMSALGFNWQNWQPDLVDALMNNANRANLFTKTQYDSNRADGRADVTNNPSAFGLYTLAQYNANRAEGVASILSALPSVDFSVLASTAVRVGLGGTNNVTLAEVQIPEGWDFDEAAQEIYGRVEGVSVSSALLLAQFGTNPAIPINLNFTPLAAPPIGSVKLSPATLKLRVGRKSKVMVVVENNSTIQQQVDLEFFSSNPSILPAPPTVPLTVPGKKSGSTRPVSLRRTIDVTGLAAGDAELRVSAGMVSSSPCAVVIQQSTRR